MNNLENIEKLEFPYSIRKRPGVFGADLITPNLLFREVVDNTVDLALKTRKSITVTALMNKADWQFICDNGSGIPLYLDRDYPVEQDRPIIVDLLSKLNVGSNFTKTAYSLGMHGLGNKGANALSDYFNVYVNAEKQSKSNLPRFIQQGIKDNKPIFVIRFEKGLFQNMEMISLSDILKKEFDESKLKEQKDITEFLSNLNSDFGTLVAFQPDRDMHESLTVSYHGYPVKLLKSLFQYDSDLKDIDFKLTINGKELEAYSFNKTFNDNLIQDKVFSQSVSIKTDEPLPIKFIYQIGWCADKFNFDFDGSVNLLQTSNGKHINLVLNAINQAFVKFNPLIKANDAKLGMRLFVLNLLIEPLFNSQDKTKLSKIEDRGYDEKLVVKKLADSFLKLMEENSDYFNLLCQRILEYKKATDKLSNIELLKSKFVLGDEGDKRRVLSGNMSDVYDCSSNDWSKNELYIVEGRSAMGGLLKNRNKLYQAIIPLRGKLANTSEFDEERLADNKEVLAIINTIGCGIGGICDPSKSRYGKIILGVDSDNDGSHIANLITTLFYQHAPEMIKQGYLYKLEAPFYLVEDGKKKQYFYQHEKNLVDFSKKVTKLKGLGSYTDEESRKFLLDPKQRKLVQIKWDPDFEQEIHEAGKLMYSGVARRNLMLEMGVFTQENVR